MRSSAHRANVLNNNFTEIGIGVAEGQYQGRTSFFVVQLFGRPAPKKSANQLALLPQKPALLVSEQIDTTNSEGSFISVKGAEIIDLPAEEQNQEQSFQSGFLERIFSAPRQVVNNIYLIIGSLIAVALMLTIFIEIRVQRPKVILNGVLLLLLVGGVFVLNQYILFSQVKVF